MYVIYKGGGLKMKRVYTQPEAELIVFDVNDVQMGLIEISDQKASLKKDSFAGDDGVSGFNWDSSVNGTKAKSFNY